MWLCKRIGRNLRQARSLAADARRVYFATSARAVGQGKARLDDLSRLGRMLGPRLRQFVDVRIESLQHRLDELNRSLAERAIPSERRDRVRHLSHEAGHPDRHSLHVVRREPEASKPRARGGAAAPRRKRPGSSTQLSGIKSPVCSSNIDAAAVPARKKPVCGAGRGKPSNPGKPIRTRVSLKTRPRQA